MAYNRMPLKDPRTVAREIPGIFDLIFPQLTPGVVAYFNKQSDYLELHEISDELISQSTLQKAMLFEIAFAWGEQLLIHPDKPDWDECLNIAIERQRRHFDAKPPDGLSSVDQQIAILVGENLVQILHLIEQENPEKKLQQSPIISGFQWIASGHGDFSIARKLIEVKCTARNFGSADLRQILMYWILSSLSSIEAGQTEWQSAILVNPRRCKLVEISFNELIEVTAAGKSKIEILELFASIVGDYALKALPEFRL